MTIITSFKALRELCADENDPSAIFDLLGRLDFARAASEVVSDDRALGTIAEKSYLHANGFIKLILSRQRGTTLRLHLWPKVPVDGTHATTIHNHRWDLFSQVRSGEVENIAYEPASGSNAFLAKRYISDGVHEHLESLGTASLRVGALTRLPAGGRYFVPKGSIHQTIIKCASLTLVVTKNSGDEPIQVYTPIKDEKENNEFLRVALTGDEVRAALISSMDILRPRKRVRR